VNRPDSILEVSVVIPTRGRPHLLRDTLAGFAAQSFDAARWETVVVLAGADEATVAVVREWERSSRQPLRAVQAPAASRAAARNAGIEASRGRVVLMVDDDVRPDPRLVELHARHHEGRDDTVVLGALPLEPQEREPGHRRKARAWWSREMERRAASGQPPGFRDFVTGNVSVCRSRLLAEGGFDASFSAYGREDYELGYRLLRAGLRFVHEPAAVGVHRDRTPALDWLRRPREEGRADAHFVRTHPELAADIRGAVPYRRVPWIAPLVRLSEIVALRMNDRPGTLWRLASGYAQAAQYWRGVAEETRRSRRPVSPPPE
jgi:glycosyltransferase involved in cell wall biosynthesis